MTDPPRETSDDAGMMYDPKPTTRMPRWVKLVAIGEAILVLVLALVVVLLIGRGDCDGGYGPGHHGSGGAGGLAPSAGVTQTQAPPAGGHG